MTTDATRFEDRCLDGAVFANCAMARSRFEDVDLTNAAIVDVNLRGATVRNVNMAGMSIDDANIEGLTIVDANLRGATFRNVDMAGVSIDDANIEGLTIFGQDVPALLRDLPGSAAPDAARAVTAEPQLFVSDIDAACRFYADKLGFRLVASWGRPAFHAQMARDGWRLNLCAVNGPVFDEGFRTREPAAPSATLVASDAEPFFREFEAAGADFHTPLTAQPWGAATFILRDPDGNLIAVAGPSA